jgi:hypothetical protein
MSAAATSVCHRVPCSPIMGASPSVLYRFVAERLPSARGMHTLRVLIELDRGDRLISRSLRGCGLCVPCVVSSGRPGRPS